MRLQRSIEEAPYWPGGASTLGPQSGLPHGHLQRDAREANFNAGLILATTGRPSGSPPSPKAGIEDCPPHHFDEWGRHLAMENISFRRDYLKNMGGQLPCALEDVERCPVLKKGVRELRRRRLTSAREAYDLARGLGIHWLLPSGEESEKANRGIGKDALSSMSPEDREATLNKFRDTIDAAFAYNMQVVLRRTQAIRNSTGARRNITPPRPRTDASPRVARPTSPLGQRSRGYHTHTPDLPRMRSVSAPLASQADQLAYARSRTLSGARFPSGGASNRSYERPKARTASTSDSLCSYDQAQQVPRPLARPRRRQAPETHLASVSPMSESSHGSLVERRRGTSGRGLSCETSGSQTRPKRSTSGEGVHQSAVPTSAVKGKGAYQSAEPTSAVRPVQPRYQPPATAQRRRPASSAVHNGGQRELLAAPQRLQQHASSPTSSLSSPTSTVTTREETPQRRLLNSLDCMGVVKVLRNAGRAVAEVFSTLSPEATRPTRSGGPARSARKRRCQKQRASMVEVDVDVLNEGRRLASEDGVPGEVQEPPEKLFAKLLELAADAVGPMTEEELVAMSLHVGHLIEHAMQRERQLVHCKAESLAKDRQIADLKVRIAHALANNNGKEPIEVEDVQPADPLLLVPPAQSNLDKMPVADVETRISRIHDEALEGSEAHAAIYAEWVLALSRHKDYVSPMKVLIDSQRELNEMCLAFVKTFVPPYIFVRTHFLERCIDDGLTEQQVQLLYLKRLVWVTRAEPEVWKHRLNGRRVLERPYWVSELPAVVIRAVFMSLPPAPSRGDTDDSARGLRVFIAEITSEMHKVAVHYSERFKESPVPVDASPVPGLPHEDVFHALFCNSDKELLPKGPFDPNAEIEGLPFEVDAQLTRDQKAARESEMDTLIDARKQWLAAPDDEVVRQLMSVVNASAENSLDMELAKRHAVAFGLLPAPSAPSERPPSPLAGASSSSLCIIAEGDEDDEEASDSEGGLDARGPLDVLDDPASTDKQRQAVLRRAYIPKLLHTPSNWHSKEAKETIDKLNKTVTDSVEFKWLWEQVLDMREQSLWALVPALLHTPENWLTDEGKEALKALPSVVWPLPRMVELLEESLAIQDAREQEAAQVDVKAPPAAADGKDMATEAAQPAVAVDTEPTPDATLPQDAVEAVEESEQVQQAKFEALSDDDKLASLPSILKSSDAYSSPEWTATLRALPWYVSTSDVIVDYLTTVQPPTTPVSEEVKESDEAKFSALGSADQLALLPPILGTCDAYDTPEWKAAVTALPLYVSTSEVVIAHLGSMMEAHEEAQNLRLTELAVSGLNLNFNFNEEEKEEEVLRQSSEASSVAALTAVAAVKDVSELNQMVVSASCNVSAAEKANQVAMLKALQPAQDHEGSMIGSISGQSPSGDEDIAHLLYGYAEFGLLMLFAMNGEVDEDVDTTYVDVSDVDATEALVPPAPRAHTPVAQLNERGKLVCVDIGEDEDDDDFF